MSFARTWITALLPPVATLAGAWALAAGPALEPDGEPPLSTAPAARGAQIHECRAASHGSGLPPGAGCRRDNVGQSARVAHLDDDRFFDKTQP